MEGLIWGRNPVREALRAGSSINKLLVAKGARGNVQELIELARKQHVPIQFADKKALDSLVPTSSHQGVVAAVSAKEYVSVEEILEKAKKDQKDPLILVLAGWEDPQNFGAILRSAEAAGVHGIVIPSRRAVPLTGSVAKASAGALEHLSVSRVTNLSNTIRDLKERGFWVVGADPEAQLYLYEADFKGPLVLVIGGEGKGIPPSLLKLCDFLVKIPMCGKINSLNATVAGSLLLYEVMRQHLAEDGKGMPFGRDSSG